MLTSTATLATLLLLAAESPAVLESTFSHHNLDLTADPEASHWKTAPRIQITRDYLSQPVAGAPTEVRSRWTKTHLYLLFICPYDELNMKTDPHFDADTPRLWNWDVAEAFLGSDFEHIKRYKELQVSPQGEWVDLDIDREHPKENGGMGWNSGYEVKARIDALTHVWYGEMRIPFSAIDPRPPLKGNEFRAGLYRISGTNPKRAFHAWQPTGQRNFHVPEAFGLLRLR